MRLTVFEHTKIAHREKVIIIRNTKIDKKLMKEGAKNRKREIEGERERETQTERSIKREA